jgi:Ni2+-binding GTPase involved in maturation of urease and hydrogenase
VVSAPEGDAHGPELLLFTGFLGSGKTTLIMALAKEAALEGLKTAFIVNEIGEIGVDKQVMRDGGLEVYEITSGCICCQIGIDLVNTLQLLAETQRPELVVVEASGVATPRGVVDALAYYKGPPFIRVRSIGVLDPTRLEALLEVMTPLIEGQIRDVDEIVITKIDEATAEDVARAREAAAELNPQAPVYRLSALDPAALHGLAARLSPGVTTLMGVSFDEALQMTRPDLLEPFTTRVYVPGGSGVDAAGLVAELLEDIARRCVDAGSPLIGHIKCRVEAGGTRFHCHLTSLRSGARCEGAALSDAGEPPSDVGALQMDLAVLVYGLARERVDVIVREALGAAAIGGATWSLSAELSAS